MAGGLDSGKQELHQLIDRLPNDQVTAALRYMHYLCADPVLLSLLSAPPTTNPIQTSNASGTPRPRHRSLEATAFLTKKFLLH